MNKNAKILIAPDSFKGSISAADAAAAIARGLERNTQLGTAPEVLCIPIADGGEGTLDALVPPADRSAITVTGTDGRPVEAAYGHIGSTAVIEMADEPHLHFEMTVADLAAAVGLDRAYFSTLFKSVTGTTPYAYLTALRVRKACALLKSTNIPVSEVADAVGIDPQNFARIFRRITGKSPREYLATLA